MPTIPRPGWLATGPSSGPLARRRYMKRLVLTVTALGVALTVSLPGAFARVEAPKAPQADPGVTSRSITIGGTFPFSGPVSSYAPIARGMETYYRYVNARRGPDGKRGVY